LELSGKTATGVEVPAEVVESLSGGRQPAVRVTIAGHTWRSTVASRSGRFLLGVSAENRAAAGVAAGDELDVEVEPDTAPREVAVPADLAEALDREPGLRPAFDSLSYTHRKEHVRALEDAKKPETRQRRLEKTLAAVRARAGT
jgi:hypothetical protein